MGSVFFGSPCIFEKTTLYFRKHTHQPIYIYMYIYVMDSHDVVCIFLFICGGATCWLTRWLIGGDQRWRALLFD